jgi:hypothetical protein
MAELCCRRAAPGRLLPILSPAGSAAVLSTDRTRNRGDGHPPFAPRIEAEPVGGTRVVSSRSY